MVDRLLSEELGEQFGPYRVVRRLGAGGMAETFEAVREGPSGFAQRVCLKLVLPAFRNDEEFTQLFEREARMMARLRHSNIVGVIDFGSIDGTSYMAVELVDGVDLLALLRSRPGRRLDFEQVNLFALDLTTGLAHAHSNKRSVIHRDLSPSNVMVSHEGEILITDFGLAKVMDDGAHKPSQVKGKVAYMSPEQLRNEPLDGRSDLFALGVLLYECLAGRRPFDGAHDPATILAILNGEHLPLAEAAPEVSSDFAALVESLIAPDRNARPESAARLLEQLDAHPPSPWARRQLGEAVEPLQAGAVDPTLRFEPSPGQGKSGFVEKGKVLDGDVGAEDDLIPSSRQDTGLQTQFVSTAVILTLAVAGLIALAFRLLGD